MMPIHAREREGGVGPDGTSKRIEINGHLYRLYHFPGKPDREPPPETTVIPHEEGPGVFWMTYEPIAIMRGDSSS